MSYLKSLKKSFQSLTKKNDNKIFGEKESKRKTKSSFKKSDSIPICVFKKEIQLVERNLEGIEMYMKIGSTN